MTKLNDVKYPYVVRLFSNPDKNGVCSEYIDIPCLDEQTAESHRLGSVYPNGEYEGGKVLLVSEIINIENIYTDIDKETACRAHYNTSFSPEKRGADMVGAYINTMKTLALSIESNVKDDRQRAVMQEVFDGLREKYKSRYLKWIAAKSRCISSMITGPANFPVARAEKANNHEHSALVAVIEFEKNMEIYAGKNLNSVYSTQEKQTSEIDKVRRDIAGAECSHALMKAVNAVTRKHRSHDKRKEQIMLLGFSLTETNSALKPDYMDRVGFASYHLTNNLANIKRMKKRLAELELKSKNAKEHGTTSQEINGLTIVKNYDEDRLQLLFAEKPAEDVRKVLKSHGFKWSPRFTAWQRKLTANAVYSLNNLVMSKEPMQQYKIST